MASLAQGAGEASGTDGTVLVPTGIRPLGPGNDDSGVFTVLVSEAVELGEVAEFVKFVAVEAAEATEAAATGVSPSTRTGKPGQAILRSNSAFQLAKRKHPWLSVRPTSSGLGVPWMP